MITLTSKDIDIILNEYSQKVYDKEPGIIKIPYQSWRDLKALVSSNSIYHIRTSDNNLLYLDRTDGLYKSIPVTESFIKVFKERTIHMVDTNSNINAPMPNKSESVSRKGFNMNFDFGPAGMRWPFLLMAWLFAILRVNILPTIPPLSRLLT